MKTLQQYMLYIEDFIEGYFYYEILSDDEEVYVVSYTMKNGWEISKNKKSFKTTVVEFAEVCESLGLDLDELTNEMKRSALLIVVYASSQLYKAKKTFGEQFLKEAQELLDGLNSQIKESVKELEKDADPEDKLVAFPDDTGGKKIYH